MANAFATGPEQFGACDVALPFATTLVDGVVRQRNSKIEEERFQERSSRAGPLAQKGLVVHGRAFLTYYFDVKTRKNSAR